MLGLSCVVSSVYGEEAQPVGRTDTGELPKLDEPEPMTQEQTESETDKEEPTSEPVETEQQKQPEASGCADKEIKPQEQKRKANTLSSARASTIYINNADDLIDFAEKINNRTYPSDTNATLMTNINMSGKNFTPIKNYTGTFDGTVHTIQNLTIKSAENYVGLFGTIENATIKNVGVTGNISGQDCVGGIVGIDWGGSTIENCWNEASISASGDNAGGIVGWLSSYSSSSVNNCYNFGAVAGALDTGGIVGVLYGSGTVKNCFSTGAATNGSAVVSTNYGTVSNCYYLQNGSLYDENAAAATAEEFKSGKIAWLLNEKKSDGVWKQTIGTDNYPKFKGGTVYEWQNGTYHNTQQPKAPAPTIEIDSAKTTASSITVKALGNQNTYGTAEYSLDEKNWQTGNVFTDLPSNRTYTVYARYKGYGDYLQSDAGKKENVSTNPASYTISVPSTPLTAGGKDSNTISVDTSRTFELGYNGKVMVKIKDNGKVTNGKLKLTRSGDSDTITSALLVDKSAFTDITKPVAAFSMTNYTSEKAVISFAEPTETDIPAGTYSETITFEVSYSEPTT